MRLARSFALAPLALAACSLSGLDAYSERFDAAVVVDASVADAPSDVVPPKDAVVDVPIDAPPAPCNLSAPFNAPTPVTSLNTNTTIDGAAALSPDQLTVYFISDRLGQGSNLFTASRNDVTAPFGAIAPLASLNYGGADTWNATLTADLRTAYIVTDQGAADNMYVVTRPSSLVAFGTPTKMPAPVVDGRQPFVLPNGSALYYSDATGGKRQIARTPLGGPLAPQTIALTLPTPHDYGIPVVNATETIMYFGVWDNGVFTSYDVWVTTRAKATDPWGAPVPVTEINTTAFDAPSWVSGDGCTLYFTRAPASGVNWDIWTARKPP